MTCCIRYGKQPQFGDFPRSGEQETANMIGYSCWARNEEVRIILAGFLTSGASEGSSRQAGDRPLRKMGLYNCHWRR